ncbi:MAG: glycosyltransferase, partial [Myxococcota bacterium]
EALRRMRRSRALSKLYPDIPNTVVLNGFDAAPKPSPPSPMSQTRPEQRRVRQPNDPLHIVYTGMIYPGQRDPTPLFQAVKRLGSKQQLVQIHFYGRYQQNLHQLAERYDLQEQVHIHGTVDHATSKRLQHEADLLLLLIWLHPRGKVGYTGKLFEYIATGRPILAIVPEGGVAAHMIEERGLGYVAQEPEQIAELLTHTLDHPEALEARPAEAREGLSRLEQVRKLVGFLDGIVASAPVLP